MLDIISEQEAQSILKTKRTDNKIVQNEDTSFDTLVQLTKLPSDFKGYPEGTKISYKPITLGELESLNSGTLDVTRCIAMLLNSIHCNTLQPQDLYYWDVMYIGIRRKLLAFGDTRGVIYDVCPNCGNTVQREFEYTELDFKPMEAPDLPLILEINNTEVEFSELTMKDFLDVDVEKGEIEVYARMIKNLPYEQAFELCKNAHTQDLRKIKFVEKQLDYGLKPFVVKCDGKKDNKKCNYELKMEVKSPFEVVFPQNTDFGPIEFQVHYGKK